MPAMRFSATIYLGGKTATGIPVPDEVVTELGSGKRPAVRVTVAGHTYRSTVANMGSGYLIPLSAELRELTGLSAGDEVDVEVELDTQPREVTVPDDLKDALADEAAASQFFDGLSYSNQRGYVLWIEQAKKAETRQARVERAVSALREGKNRY
jgi:hypothetical protein